MAHFHQHSCECKHENLKLCKTCKVPFCQDCGKEWAERCTLNHGWYWQYPYSSSNTYPGIVYCGTQTVADTSNGVTSSSVQVQNLSDYAQVSHTHG